MSAKKTDPIKTLYPGTIEIAVSDEVFSIRPLKIREFPLVSKAVTKILKQTQEGKSVEQMLSSGFEEVLEVLKVCVDKPIDDVPIGYLPVFLQAFLDQNITGEDVLGNWRSLIQSLVGLVDQVAPQLAKEVRKASSGQ